MPDLITLRRNWSSDQKRLREMLKGGTSLDQSRELFYSQHAVLHSQKMSGMGGWSYADEVFTGLEEGQFRIIPEKKDHSLIWILWHISRIEDVTMNVLVAGGSQVYLQDQWKKKLTSPIDHVGNLINTNDLIDLTRNVNLQALFDYRDAVGRQTRFIVSDLDLEELGQKVQNDRLVRLVNEGAVLPDAEDLLDYWRKRKIFEMLLMPPTRHLMTHLNEAIDLRRILEK